MTTYNLAPIPRWQFTNASCIYNAQGKLYTFRALSRNEPKAVYQDKAGLIAYSNPIVFDGIGSVKPIYWASDENYYIELRDTNGTQVIWTVDDFNATKTGGGPAPSIAMEYRNCVLNGQFDIFSVLETSKLISNNDSPCYLWSFIKNGAGSVDQFSFVEFTPSELDSIEANPQYYLYHECTTAGSGATYKEYRQRLGHVGMFANEAITFNIWARGFSGSQYLKIFAYQNFGTGGSAEVQIPLTASVLPNSRFDLNDEWVKYSVTVIIPNIHEKTIGPDNYFDLAIQLPLNVLCAIGFTNVQWNLGNQKLQYEVTNPYELRPTVLNELCAAASPISNWDKPVSITASNTLFNQRGKVPKTTYSTTTNQLNFEWSHDMPLGSMTGWLTSTSPTGWLLCDGSTASSTEYYDLYTLLGQTYGEGNGMFGVSRIGTTARVTNYFPGVCSAPTDLGTSFILDVITAGCAQGADVKVCPTNNITINPCNFLDGVWLVKNDRVLLCNQIDKKQNGLYVYGASIAPIGLSRTAETGSDIALHSFYVTHGFINANRSFYCTNTSIVFHTTEIVFNRTGGRQVLEVTCGAASTFSNGASFLVPMFDGATVWQVVMVKNGSFNFTPAASATNFAYAYVNSTDTSALVATAVYNALNPSSFSLPPFCGMFLRGVDHGVEIDTQPFTRMDRGDGTAGDNVGTRQMDDILTHTHSYTSGYNSTGGSITAYNPLILAGEDLTSYELKDNTTTNMVGAYNGYENLIRNVSINWIIKYK